jgi:hypothetical protein
VVVTAESAPLDDRVLDPLPGPGHPHANAHATAEAPHNLRTPVAPSQQLHTTLNLSSQREESTELDRQRCAVPLLDTCMRVPSLL